MMYITKKHLTALAALLALVSCASSKKMWDNAVSNLNLNPTEHLTSDEKLYYNSNKEYLSGEEWKPWLKAEKRDDRDKYIESKYGLIAKRKGNPCYREKNLNKNKSASAPLIALIGSPSGKVVEGFEFKYKSYEQLKSEAMAELVAREYSEAEIKREMAAFDNKDLICIVTRAPTIDYANPQMFEFIFKDNQGRMIKRFQPKSSVPNTPDSSGLWWATECTELPAAKPGHVTSLKIYDRFSKESTDYKICSM